MVPTLFFYQLGLVALVWVFLMLYWLGPPGAAARRQPIVIAKPPRRKRSNEPKAFAGLTTKPPCALCAQEAASPQASRLPPDPMPPTHRRPRTVDTSRHFCPHMGCDYRGWLGLNNLRANGHPSGGPWRQWHCLGCNGYVSEHHGPIFHGKQAAVERIVRVLACLVEGLGIRATTRVCEVDPNTVLQWLVEAAEQLRAFSAYFLWKRNKKVAVSAFMLCSLIRGTLEGAMHHGLRVTHRCREGRYQQPRGDQAGHDHQLRSAVSDIHWRAGTAPSRTDSPAGKGPKYIINRTISLA